ncbi:MAG TPA: nitrile hydratase subunit beta [Aestuariivirga sp.]|nr:nitrile hydratase subunit beta [Aestuariivirga sp.]
MNGPQDMGGQAGFGPISPEADEPWFHEPWERRAFALSLAMGMTGSWNIDISRHARERLPALQYWRSSYYEVWIAGLVTLMTDAGLASTDEIANGRASTPPKPVARVATAAMIPAILQKGGPANRKSDLKARFRAGDKIRTRNISPEGHTRLPRYARGKAGEIIASHGTHVLPDSSAHRLGDDPQWLYTVRFTANELWGRANNDQVMLDLWEPYLEPA